MFHWHSTSNFRSSIKTPYFFHHTEKYKISQDRFPTLHWLRWRAIVLWTELCGLKMGETLGSLIAPERFPRKVQTNPQTRKRQLRYSVWSRMSIRRKEVRSQSFLQKYLLLNSQRQRRAHQLTVHHADTEQRTSWQFA